MRKYLTRLSTILLAAVLFLCSFSISQAMTDDARVLGGIDKNTDIYAYLNSYPYSLWKTIDAGNEVYITEDHCVAVDLWSGHLGQIFLLGPGYKTDKGIEVGMTLKDVENTYGTIVYDYKKEKQYYHTPYGSYTSDKYTEDYKGYATVEYVSPQNEGLNFVIDMNTEKIVLIMYQTNRHGNSWVMSYVRRYDLLPKRYQRPTLQ